MPANRCAGAPTLESLVSYRRQDIAKNGIKVAKHTLVRNPEDAQPADAKDGVAFGAIPLAVLMYQTVYLHDQPGGVAVEVHDEAIDDLLPAQMQSPKFRSSQRVPQAFLSRRHLTLHR